MNRLKIVILLVCLVELFAYQAVIVEAAPHKTRTISGSLTPGSITAGATVTLSGNSSVTTAADANGNYSFPGVASGTYSITPAKAGVAFQPATRSVTLTNGNLTGVNFSATTTAAQLGINPSNFSFGNANVGSTAQMQATLTATGGDVTITNDTVIGSGFGINGIAFPLTIPSGTSTNLFVTFSPASTGSVSGSLSFSNSGTNLATASLSGLGAGLTVSPSSVNFGQVADGTTSSPQTIALTAVGSTVTITSDSLVQNGGGGNAFTITGAPSLPFTIAAGQSAQVSTTFAPGSGSPGTAAGTLTVTSNINSVSANLGGTGVANVSLSWTTSTTPSVAYNVFRCSTSAIACAQNQPGNFTRIASGVPGISYTDSAVSSGQTYYYALTAVDTNSTESSLSTVSSPITIP